MLFPARRAYLEFVCKLARSKSRSPYTQIRREKMRGGAREGRKGEVGSIVEQREAERAEPAV
ncbi:uncharacterized protein G2W53_038494 [Senna tora]|uniref:Uncharacterized protein n=1 Tax=Senna tora TaxID=362788 RepID=A0A834SL62_9FABA|nr:uncharacterized protein G2W53_038494 [Senna tora]